MVSVSKLPPSDLLQQFEGVENSLRHNRRVSHFAWIGLLAGVFEGTIVLASNGLSVSGDNGLLVPLAAVLLVGSLLVLARTTFWVRESRTPLRYTCSVDNFRALGHVAGHEFQEIAVWMRYDLAQRLDERIRRVAFLENAPAGARDDDTTSHIHISGEYLIRSKGTYWELQITPRVRVGAPGSPDTLGHAVTFMVLRHPESHPVSDVRADLVLQETSSSSMRPADEPPISDADYGKLIERVYFSTATQIYKQLRSDVQRKIALLPRGFLRATAYLYEADDYAHSNTLDAYDEAADLYKMAMALYDPSLRPLPRRTLAHPIQWFAQWKSEKVRDLRPRISFRWPRLARREVYAAKAETGYASVILYRRILAGMSGHRVNSIYEARPMLERAIARLSSLSDRVPGKREALFHGHVALALAWQELEFTSAAKQTLTEARRILPVAFELDASYLYVAGMLEPHGRSALPLFRQAVERDPRFEVAAFELALRDEMAWRRIGPLEPTVAAIVLAEYEQVLKLNPGNVRAWGNMGYISWLLDDLEPARRFYERGREYKELNPGIQVAALDFGLARIEAEDGNLARAYTYYRRAVSAKVAIGASDSRYTSAQYHSFDYVGDPIVARYDLYRHRVRRVWGQARLTARRAAASRINNAVLANMYNDCGEACHTYYIRSHTGTFLHQAMRYYRRSSQLNPNAVLPHYNLHLLYRYLDDAEQALEELEQVAELEPTWPDVVVAVLTTVADCANERASESQDGVSVVTPDERTGRVTHRDGMIARVHGLVPHGWMWREDSNGDSGFNWSSLDDERYRRELRWERELNDFHVRVLFSWCVAALFMRFDNDDRDEDNTGESASTQNGGAEVVFPSKARAKSLLIHIRHAFWPANDRVLAACRQIDPDDGEAQRGLHDLIERWLMADPTAHWALEDLTKARHDLSGQPIELFTKAEMERHLRRAKEQCDPASDLSKWIDERLLAVPAPGRFDVQ